MYAKYILMTNVFVSLILGSIVQCKVGNQVTNSQNDEVLHPVVQIMQGKVRGNRIGVPNYGLVDVFWGIPYAKPPTGELRFAHPVPVEPWSGVHNATAMPNTCHQIGRSSSFIITTPISEDCLYLNVFAPKSRSDTGTIADSTLLPPKQVMVFVHGGGFIRGTSAIEQFDATTLAAVNDVVVVTFNYRVGAFGYLFSATEDAPGNAGFFDQLMALEWVRNNVAHFGGDPGSVTLFGESAGSTSIGMIILSPLTRHLFKRAILSSGCPTSKRLFMRRQPAFDTVIRLARVSERCNRSEILSDDVGTDEERLVRAVRCLKQLSERELDAAQDKIVTIGFVVDGRFLPDEPHRLLANAVTKNVSVLLGRTRNDGIFFLPRVYADLVAYSNNATVSQAQLTEIIGREAKKHYANAAQHVLLTHQYTNWQDLENGSKNLKMAGLLVGDTFIVCPIVDFGHRLSAVGVDVQMYMFNHRISTTKERPRWLGIIHGDDMPFIFGLPLHNKNYTKAEAELSLRVMKHFVNFAKFGNPSFDDFQWPKYSEKKRDIVLLDTKPLRVIKDPRVNACALWNIAFPKLENMSSESLKNLNLFCVYVRPLYPK